MRASARILIAAALAAGAGPAAAFLVQSTQGPNGDVVQVSWPGDTVPFVIDAGGSDDLARDQTARILRESFGVWEAVSGARIRFLDRGLTSGRTPSRRDRRNLVIFDETGAWLSAPGSGIIAVTRVSSDALSGHILDADIIFNGRDHRFSAEPRPGRIVLKDVAVHEIGHFLGLDHTPLSGDPAVRPTMNPFYFGDGPGEAASLEADDVAGVSFLYPANPFQTTGTISGHVSTADGRGVFGARVTAEEVSSKGVYATLSGAETGAADPGAYTLRGLAPGRYRVAITPVTGPIDEDDFGGIFSGFETDFPSEYYDNVDRPGLARPVDIAPGSLHATQLDFATGFLVPGQPFVRAVDEPGNTPDALGPYQLRFTVTGAAHAELIVEIGGRRLAVPMRHVEGDLFEARIPGQPVGSVVRYRARAVSAQGLATEVPGPRSWLRFEVIALSGSPLAFAVLREDGVLGVFDTGSENEIARVAVGTDPVQVLTSLDGRYLYVSNLASAEISVVETATFRVVDRIAVAAQPLDMALSRDGRTLFVSNSGASSITRIDVATRTVVSRTRVGPAGGDGPYGIVAGAGGRVYVTDLRDDAVLALAGGSVVARIAVAGGPRSLAIHPDGSEVYVTSFGSSRFTIIDTATDLVAATVVLPVAGSFAVAAHPNGKRVYVTGHEDGVVVVVDPAARRVIDVVPVGQNPRGLSFSPSGDRLFVTSAADDRIFVIDTATHERLGALVAGGGPRGISILAAPASPQRTTAVVSGARPERWSLSEVFPNPFNAGTTVTLTVPGPQAIEVAVYDALGQRLRTLTGLASGAGPRVLNWDGRDEAGRPAATGLYLFVARTPAGILSRKGMLLR